MLGVGDQPRRRVKIRSSPAGATITGALVSVDQRDGQQGRSADGQRGQQRVEPTAPGVTETGAPAVPVDLDDRVVDIEQRASGAASGVDGGVGCRRCRRRCRRVSTALVPSSGVSPATAIRNEATASSWRTWPKVNARRNEFNVEGA